MSTDTSQAKCHIETPELLEYIRALDRGITSWSEKAVFAEVEPTSEDERRIVMLVGDLRRRFSIEYQSDFLDALTYDGLSMDRCETQLIIAEHIHNQMTQQGKDNYWLRAIEGFHGEHHDAVYDLVVLYSIYFQHHHDLLRYLLTQEDPLLLAESLNAVSASRLKEAVEQKNLGALTYAEAMMTTTVGFVNALSLAESSQDTPDGFSDLPSEIALRLIDPVTPEADL